MAATRGNLEPSDEVHDPEEAMDIVFDHGRLGCKNLLIDHAWKFQFVIFLPALVKWNKIEHRMFSYISMNWRGKPLTSYEIIVNLI